MNWLGLAIDAVGRLPIERVLFKPPDRSKDLKELQEILQSRHAAKPPEPEPEPERTIVRSPVQPKVHLAQVSEPVVSSKETVDYQNREIGKLLLRMERHLAQKMRINGVACDCGAPKHLLDLEGMTEETVPMVDEPAVYYRVLDWIKIVGPKTTLAAVKSGRYENDYPVHSHEARDLRKEIVGTLDAGALFPEPASAAVVPVGDDKVLSEVPAEIKEGE